VSKISVILANSLTGAIVALLNNFAISEGLKKTTNAVLYI
jgi:hypothetical protein